jgi:hypothetical protein
MDPPNLFFGSVQQIFEPEPQLLVQFKKFRFEPWFQTVELWQHYLSLYQCISLNTTACLCTQHLYIPKSNGVSLYLYISVSIYL